MECFVAIATKVVTTIEVLINSKKHNTENQQPQNKANQAIRKAIAPPICSIVQNAGGKIFKTQFTQEFEQNDRTLMKCLRASNPYLVYRVFVLKMELVKLEIKQKLENLFTREIKTSETKFKDVRRARRKNCYFYHGIEVSSHSGLTRRGDELIYLKPGTKVKISTDYHSSSLSDDNRQIMIYVRPIEIETKEQYLVFLDSLIPVLEHENYNLAVLPLIKKLVYSLGLDRTDYLDYIQQTYQVSRTKYLSNNQIFQVIKYFQNLLIEPILSKERVPNGFFTKVCT